MRVLNSVRRGFSRLVLAIILIVLVLVASVAVYEFVYLPSTAQSQPIKIGFISPLSGASSQSGIQMKQGAQIGEQIVNQNGGVLGRKLEVVFADDAGNPNTAITVVNQLISQGVVAIAGVFISSEALALAPLVDQHQIPLFVVGASATAITANHYPWVFRIHWLVPDGAQAVANYIKQQGFKKLAILTDTGDYGLEWARDLGNLLNSTMDVTHITFDPTATDLTPQLLSAKQFGADVIFDGGVGAPAELMIKQAAQIGLTPAAQIIASYDFPSSSSQFWNDVGSAGVGVAWVNLYNPNEPLSDLGQQCVSMYREQFGAPPIYYAINSCGVINVIAQAIQYAGSTDANAIKSSLLSHSFKDWFTPPVTFKETQGVEWHQFTVPLWILQYTQYNQTLAQAKVLYSFTPSS